MGSIANALQDKDFLAAKPEDQMAYIASFDKDFAGAKPEDQRAYLNHVLAPARLKQSAQPTQFEKERQDPGFLSGVGDFLKGATSGIAGPVVDLARNPDFSKRNLARVALQDIPGAETALRTVATGFQHGMGRGATQFAGEQVGLDPEHLRKLADVGHTGEIAGEVAVPAAAATAGPFLKAGLEKSAPFRSRLAENITSPLVYEGTGEAKADVRSGINPARGLTREGLVGSKGALVSKAGERISDLKNASNNILQNHPNANQIIDAGPLIDKAIDDAIRETNKVAGSTGRLEALRGALKREYGKTRGTPLEINNLKSDIQEAANGLGAYKNTQPVEASAAAAMKNAARLIKESVNEKVPQVAELNQRMADLIDAQSGLNRNINADLGKSIFAGTLGRIPARALEMTVGSAPSRTLLARGLMAGLTKDVPSTVTAAPFTPRGLLAAPAPTPEEMPYRWGQDQSGAIPRSEQQSNRWVTPRALLASSETPRPGVKGLLAAPPTELPYRWGEPPREPMAREPETSIQRDKRGRMQRIYLGTSKPLKKK